MPASRARKRPEKEKRIVMGQTASTSSCEVAIIGTGPYGLSVAAHLRDTGVKFRIFGKPMDLWRNHMPKSMMLKLTLIRLATVFLPNIFDTARSRRD